MGKGTAVFEMDSDLSAPEVADDLTLGVGSAFYAAPEQLGRCSAGVESRSTSSGSDEAQAYAYSLKVDIFALGIILAELLLPTSSSRAERCAMMMGLRQRQIPAPIFESFPDVIPWLQKMLSANPEERPSTHDILQSAIFVPYIPHGTAIAANSAIRHQGIDVALTEGDAPCLQCKASELLVKELAEEVHRKDDRIAELLQQLRSLRSAAKETR